MLVGEATIPYPVWHIVFEKHNTATQWKCI